MLGLIAQYLQENGLQASLEALQQETGLVYALPCNLESLILAGDWEGVLRAGLPLSADQLDGILEQICYERLERGDAYGGLLQRIKGAAWKGRVEEAKHTGMPPGWSRQSARAQLATRLLSELRPRELRPEQPSRLLSLLAGSRHGAPSRLKQEQQCAKGTEVTAATFLPDGRLAVGRADGLLELWNPQITQTKSGQITPISRTMQSTQLAVETRVTCLAVKGTTDLWAGCVDGSVYRWRLAHDEAKLVKIYPALHQAALSVLLPLPDEFLTGDETGLIRCTASKSGVLQRNLRGHQAAITSLISFDNCLYSASRDGTLRRWDHDGGKIVPFQESGQLPAPALVGLAVGPDGDLLVASERGLYSWKNRSAIKAGQLVGLCSDYALTANGRLICTRRRGEEAEEVETKQAAEGVCWSHAGDLMFTWTHTGICRLWSA